MVLVDTSIWIRYLAGRQPYWDRLTDLLIADEVASHELVFGEILAGSPGGRVKLLANYELIKPAPTVPHHEVVAFVRNRRLYGRGAGWIDLSLLASALVGRMQFWTADARLQALAQDLGIAFT